MSFRPLVDAVVRGLREGADPAAAEAMRASMKTHQPFFGVKTPLRRRIVESALAADPPRTRADYEGAVWALWNGKRREERYAAADVALACGDFRARESFGLYERMVRSAGWWDLCDAVAPGLVGELVLEHPGLKPRILEWAAASDPWMRRAAVLTFLKHKGRTDLSAFETVLARNVADADPFIGKAVGWALREYGCTDPTWVRRFCRRHAERASASTLREALKHLAP